MPQVPGDRLGSSEVFRTRLFYCFLAASTDPRRQVERTNLLTRTSEQMRDVMKSLRILESRGPALVRNRPVVTFATEYALGLTGYSTGLIPLRLVNAMLAGESLQLDVPAFLEAQVAGVVDYLFQRRGDQDFAAIGFGSDSRGKDDRLTVEVASLLNRLAGVHPDADPNRVLAMFFAPRFEGALDRNCA